MVNAEFELARRGRVAFVLAGGAARGAYEVGVLRYVLTEVARELGRTPPIDIICGTSVGAINACFLAAHIDDPGRHILRLHNRWTSLLLSDILNIDGHEVFAMVRGLLGNTKARLRGGQAHGGVINPDGIRRLLTSMIPFERIDEHLRAGRFDSLTVSTTHVATGRTTVFVHRRVEELPPWSHDPTVDARLSPIRLPHTLASAAIPFLFPAVEIGGELHCDGGLRQNVPLAPAHRLGADGLVVVNPRHLSFAAPATVLAEERERSFPGPLFLFGKTLNALLLDRIDNDLNRLRMINDVLEAGVKEYGPQFIDALNRRLGTREGKSTSVRTMQAVLIRASQDIGRLSGEYVRSATFARRASGWTGKLLRRLADEEGEHEGDFLSYLLFDGEFTGRLIELGRADARAKHDELCNLFAAMSEIAGDAR